MSAREKLLAVAKPRIKTIDVDGVNVTVREVSALEFADYVRQAETSQAQATASLLAACIVDDSGASIMTADEVARFPARLAVPITSAIMDVSGFGDSNAKND